MDGIKAQSIKAIEEQGKSGALALMELLTFNSRILPGHMTLAMPPFTLFWHSGVGGHQGTSLNYELL